MNRGGFLWFRDARRKTNPIHWAVAGGRMFATDVRVMTQCYLTLAKNARLPHSHLDLELKHRVFQALDAI